MQTLGIITYDYPHLKTEQILLGILRRNAGVSVRVYALPFSERKPRAAIFKHRPDQRQAAHPGDLCLANGLAYTRCASDLDIEKGCDVYLLCGAGILSRGAVRDKRILNLHPGIVPAVRGLDAFKWAVYSRLPVGNTLHYIDEQIDMGEIVSIESTPVFFSDSLASFARRHYECEIEMMTRFDAYLASPKNEFKDLRPLEPSRRMDAETENAMFAGFDAYKEKYAVR